MKLKLLFFISVITFSFSNKIIAQTDVNNAQAVFIYNFLSYIQWPETDISNKYIIGVYGQTTTYDYLKKYTTNRKVGNKTIEIIQITAPIEAINCHVLLVASSKSNQIAELKDILLSKSCLIVGEKAGTTEYGAVVDFHIIGNKLRYKIDQKNAKDHNLFVSTALLSMSL